jgi:hypothetical protein
MPRLIKKLWQIYEFTVPVGSGTTGSAIKKLYYDILHGE